MKSIDLTFISDTHLNEPKLKGGDILFHCGDLSINGFRSEIIKALNYLHEQTLKYKYVVITGGNHDFWIERHLEEFKDACLSAGIVALINEGVELEGLNIYGTPISKPHHDWAFNYGSTEREYLLSRIPDNTDILLSHGPAIGILDVTSKGDVIGDPLIYDRIEDLNLKIHAFGHVHESHGQIKIKNTLFLNCATKPIDITLKID